LEEGGRKELNHKEHKEHKEHEGEQGMSYQPIPPEDEELAHRIIGAAIEVHRVLGSGFLEKIYERALYYELKKQGIPCEPQKEIMVPYKEIEIPGQQLDLLVGGRIIVELKAVSELHPLHQAQLLSYLKATSLRLGLLINFNVPVLKDGIKRLVR
jgi:GxxExxY protein